jgi:hypothetical protein
MSTPLSRRDLLRDAVAAAAALLLPVPLLACTREAIPLTDPDRSRLDDWTAALRSGGLSHRKTAAGQVAARVGELATGTPYVPHTLEAYLDAGASAPLRSEPLILSLTRFDCVTLVEACLAVARTAAAHVPSWDRFGREVERVRYRDGKREGYTSRLHYFSEWIANGQARDLVRDLGAELGGTADERPLRFMTEHRTSYVALEDEEAFRKIGTIERSLDGHPRLVVPTARIPEVANRIQSGDILAFATSIPGLDVTHAAFAYRDSAGVLRVLHAPLSGGVVEVTRSTLPEYVAAIKRATGILVARPAWAI